MLTTKAIIPVNLLNFPGTRIHIPTDRTTNHCFIANFNWNCSIRFLNISIYTCIYVHLYIYISIYWIIYWFGHKSGASYGSSIVYKVNNIIFVFQRFCRLMANKNRFPYSMLGLPEGMNSPTLSSPTHYNFIRNSYIL